MASTKSIKTITRVKYEDGGRWCKSPAKIKELFRSGLELTVEYRVNGRLTADLATDLAGHTVVIDGKGYRVGKRGLVPLFRM